MSSNPANSASASSSSAAASSEESRWKKWGKTAFDKSIVVSDWASGYANSASAKMGGERFWPKSNDFPEEIAKCERILRAFTVEGIETKPAEKKDASEPTSDAEAETDAEAKKKDGFMHKKRKVLRKIPPAVIKRAKGIVIYTAMRSGIAPFGGAGGAGLMLARMPDGSWSAPSSISPNNLAVGLLLGFDIFDVILVVNTERAMESFKSHKVTLGAETAVAAGPFGTGISGEMGIDRSPVFSYVRSRGLYGGVEAMAQAFLHRFDENERIYYWPGITAADIFEGKVRKPPMADPLYRALRDAETGVAQGDSLERWVYEPVHAPPNIAVRQLQQQESAELLQDGERLKLPPTPEELEAMEEAGIPDDFDIALEKREAEEARVRAEQERREIFALPPPPRHKQVERYWESRGTVPGGKRRVAPPPSPLHTEAVAGDRVESLGDGDLETVDLVEQEKPPLPPRNAKAVESLADELDATDLQDDVPAYEAGEASMPLDAEHTPSSPIKPSLAKELGEDAISRSSSLSRPSRPPRRAARAAAVAGAASASPGPATRTDGAALQLFIDWDETITATDTLSLIAPPEGEQEHGPAFSHYTEAYLSDLKAYETSFGERNTWDRQLEFLAEMDSVEVESVTRVQDGGLFKGVTRASLLERAQKVEFRTGWQDFYAWLGEHRDVVAEIISVGWSAAFIRQAIESHSPTSDPVIREVWANEVEMDDGVGTGALTKAADTHIRTAHDKMRVMNQRATATTVFIGDSTTDLPSMLSAHYGIVMKNMADFKDSSINRCIQTTKPPLTKLYTDHTEFLDQIASIEAEKRGVLVRVDDWIQALAVIQAIERHTSST
ncbi:uncharacterized conserved protein [Moesziomyces antarcticus T-34]|uniref:Uncharacterized conserved protein n=1 Tax=Pseudozyma antarctica (strain T-34) TaxID=1151754 RepID=M9MID0_PSEA3|nr:uncharacterized conserved protein [Moesziomyces antarcticus T-34]